MRSRLDPASVAIIGALALLVGLVIGILPVLRLARLNVNVTLREEGRGGTSGRGAHLLRRGLATAQVAIAFTLLIGAGLLLASFRAVLKLDPGFSPDACRRRVVRTAVDVPTETMRPS